MAKNETPTKEITIQKHAFTVTAPYAEGHTITEAEAAALNQTRHENIRNNMARKIKDMLGDAETLTEEQMAEMVETVAEYDASYEFTLASVGGARKTKDPIDVEAGKIARAHVNAKIKEAGHTLTDFKSTDEGKAKYDAAVEKVMAMEAVQAEAKRIVEQRTAMAQAGMDELDI